MKSTELCKVRVISHYTENKLRYDSFHNTILLSHFLGGCMETSIETLVNSIISELKRLQYSKMTIGQFKTVYRKYLRYAESKGVQDHSIEFADKWLVEECKIDIAKIDPGSPKRKTRIDTYNSILPVRAMQCLIGWQLHHHLPLQRKGKLASLTLSPSFQTGFNQFRTYCIANGFSECGSYGRLNRIKRMLLYFESQKITDLEEINAKCISNYVKTQMDLAPRTVATVLSTIRCFFHQLYIEKLIDKDLSADVPKAKVNRSFKLPSVWKTVDVQKLLVL
jgi:integrase/recombinase XerD